ASATGTRTNARATRRKFATRLSGRRSSIVSGAGKSWPAAMKYPSASKRLKGRRKLTEHRFSPPWIVEELEACFYVCDSAGQKLAFVYFEEEPGRRSAAK